MTRTTRIWRSLYVDRFLLALHRETDSARERVRMIDVNVYLSEWPFRRLAGDDAADLAARLRQRNVTQAWTGSFDGIFHKDLSSANTRLANDCHRHAAGLLVPFGSVSPRLPDWQEDLRRCHEEHKMPGIRLHPNYHGYDLKDPIVADLLHSAAARGMVVQVVVSMEDERTQHPLMRVPPVDLSPLSDLVKNEPRLRVVVLNSDPLHKAQQLERLATAGEVCFDIAMVEGVGGVARLAQKISVQRVLFGSNYPMFYFESAFLKTRESGFTDVQLKPILEENARRLLNT
jgi:uncharacterized protein